MKGIKKLTAIILSVILVIMAMPLCASAINKETQIDEISIEFDLQEVIGKKFYEYVEFVKVLNPNILFEPDPQYSSLMFFNTDTGEQVRDEIVEGEEYGVCLNLYPADGYRIKGESRVAINGKELIQFSQYEITTEYENTNSRMIMFGIIAGKEIEYKKIDSVSLSFDSVACAGKTADDYGDIVTINSEHLNFVDYEADLDGDGTNEPLYALNIYHTDGTVLARGEAMKAGEEYQAYIYTVADFGYYMVASELDIEINDGADCGAGYGIGVGRIGRTFLSVGFNFVAGEPLEKSFFESFLQKITEFFEELFDKILEFFI